MKKIKIFAVILWLIMLIFTIELADAQSFNKLDNEPHDIVYYKAENNPKPQIKVLYGRPKADEETVFGTKVPFGKIWRTGANEATEIKFYTDVMFGNKFVKAGSYVLYTIPKEDYWTIILNSNTDTIGEFFYNPKNDIARLDVPVSKDNSIDIFSIGFDEKQYGVQMVLAWGETRVKVPFYTKEKLLTKI
ncbi:MAG: DUF2911 domain-containing protein [Bacteroidota bacterium]